MDERGMPGRSGDGELRGWANQPAPYANAENLAAKIPGAELELVVGGRHGCFDESRDSVTRRSRRSCAAETSNRKGRT